MYVYIYLCNIYIYMYMYTYKYDVALFSFVTLSILAESPLKDCMKFAPISATG